MLEQLNLSNLALSVEAEVDFTPGMICITGETGAGKSLVVDALALVLGAKADANMVRQGQKQLEVSARFFTKSLPKVYELLQKHGFIDEEEAHQAITISSAIANESTQQDASANEEAQALVDADNKSSENVEPNAVALSESDESSKSTSDESLAKSADKSANKDEATATDAINAAPVLEESGNSELEAAAQIDTAVEADGQAIGLNSWQAHFEGELVLRRVVTCEGKSKAYINGHLATLAQLREIGECLVAIHGQHASIKLIDAKNQLETLDNFGKLKPLVQEVNAAYNNYSNLRSELTKLADQQKLGALSYKQDRYDLEELRKLGFEEGDYEKLEAMFDRAMNQAKFSYVLANFNALVSDSENNVLSLLRNQVRDIDNIKSFDDNIGKILEGLETAIAHLEEATGTAEELSTRPLEYSTTELEERMHKAHTLARRFSCSPKELYLMTARMEHKISEFLGLKDRIVAMTQEVKDARKLYEDKALELSAKRNEIAQDFSVQICQKIKLLALPDARFDIELKRDEESKPRLNGRDEICFMFSANLGQNLRPLATVASGGELSRLALAIEVLTASVKSTPTLIFDEVDTGISGRTASAVGSLLHELGQYVQVITVTHLPQVAAKANTQFVVAKFNEDGAVNSTITPLDGAGRIEEISRMIGGSVITETTRQSARELLSEG